MKIQDFISKLLGRKSSNQFNFYIDQNKIAIREEGGSIRLSTLENQNVLFPNQTIGNIKELLLSNYKTVKEHYRPSAEKVIPIEDLNDISLKIVIDRLYMYNMWRIWYKKQENRDLNFRIEDFEHPDLTDTILLYLRKKYPSDYSQRCEMLFDMTKSEFEAYEKNRNSFFNK